MNQTEKKLFDQEIDERKLTFIGQTLRKYEEEILKNIEMVVLMIDSRGRVLFCNDYLAKISGWRREEIIGSDWFDKFIPDGENLRKLFDTNLQEKKIFPHYENPILTKTKEKRDISWSNIFFEGEDKSIIGVISLGLDVTGRKKAESDLRESEQKYSTIVEEGNDGIVIIQNEKIEFANRRMVDITGFSREESVGRYFVDFIDPGDKELVFRNYKKRMKGERAPGRYEAMVLKRNRGSVPVEIDAIVIKFRNSPAVLAIIRDITERKKAEDLLRHSEEKYRLLFETMSSGVICHDEEGKIASVNPAAEAILRKGAASILGRHFFELTPGAVREDGSPYSKEEYPTELVLRTNKKISEVMGLPAKKRNGYLWMKVSVFPKINSLSKTLRGFYTLFDDITREVTAEAELERKLEEMKRINQLMIGREVKMVKLKEEIERMRTKGDGPLK